MHDVIKSDAGVASPPLKFEREDWTVFRTVEGLQQKAGVPKERLARLVLKELTDNSLDAGAEDVTLSAGRKEGAYIIEDNGPGINGTPEDIARLFSINRPMVSTKLLRLPTRGALGNGLRVVAGAVLASEGKLTVTTRNRKIELRPERDGTTTAVDVKPVEFDKGVRIEIRLGPAIPEDDNALSWARRACDLAPYGTQYKGKSSPWWYDAAQFHELLYATGDRPVRDLIAHLDCNGLTDAIIAKARLGKALCSQVARAQSTALLKAARANSTPVSAGKLGAVGDDIPFTKKWFYASARGINRTGSEPRAQIPFVVEAWVSSSDEMGLLMCVNRTPVTGEIRAARDKRDIDIYGCNLAHTVAKAKADQNFNVWINITTPHMPISSDGKAPDLLPFLHEIRTAATKAVHKAKKPIDDPEDSFLPKQKRGNPGPKKKEAFRLKLKAFCDKIREIQSRLDFAVGSRGWCYLLQDHGLRKGDFDAAEKLITACRKSGDLSLDICAEDASRATKGIEEIDKLDVPGKIDALLDDLLHHAHEDYLPISLWDDLSVYVEVVVEKLDLRNLFAPVCRELHVPLTNFKGWSDLNSRAAMMRRFKQHEAAGRKCVLLLCGDHDPGGLHITNTMRDNLKDLARAVGWDPANLIIRFGLNEDFIEENNLTWIDNLETSSGKQLDDPDHKDHDKQYVQGYIEQYGVRKCEANALVVVPEKGRQLCRDEILKHVPIEAVKKYEKKLAKLRAELKKAIANQIGPR